LSANTNTALTYYTSQNDADLSSNEINNGYVNTSNPQTIWYRLDKTNDSCFYIGTFQIYVDPFFINPEPSFVDNETKDECINTTSQTIELAIQFDNNDINNYTFLWSTGETTSSINVTNEADYSVVISTVNGCEKTQNFHVSAIVINEPDDLFICKIGNFAEFDFTNQTTTLLENNTNVEIAYYDLHNAALLQQGEIGNTYTNVVNPQEIFYRLDKLGETCFYIGSFEINVNTFFATPEPNFLFEETLPYCLESYPDMLDLMVIFNNNDINNFTFLWSTGEVTSSIAINESGDYSVEITNNLGCKEIKVFHIYDSVVFTNDEPNFMDEIIYYCTDTYPEMIALVSGIENNDMSNDTFLWSTGGDTNYKY